MKTELKRANLHTPIMVGGTNLGLRLDSKEKTGLQLLYDEDTHSLFVHYNKETMRVPEHNIAGMIEKTAAPVAAAPKFEAKSTTLSAQISTPQSHVHAGLGAGVTGQEDAIKRGPGRPPKT